MARLLLCFPLAGICQGSQDRGLQVLVKLENLSGAAMHTLEVAMGPAPPDVLLLGRKIYRYLRTDGVWDRKAHVYREATTLKAPRNVVRKLTASQKPPRAEQAPRKRA